MALKDPKSMEDCFYFTRRKLEKGSIVAWVLKPIGPHGGLLQRPLNPKSGKVMKKSEVYVERGTDYEVPCKEIDPTLKVQIRYECPECAKAGETTAPYVWKTYKGAKSIIFYCNDCEAKLGISKKLKGV